MHEAAVTPAWALVATGLFLGFGCSGIVAWLAESEWGIGLLTVLAGFSPLLWIFGRMSLLPGEGGEHGPITIGSQEITFFLSLAVGLALGLLMIRAVDRSARRALDS